MPHPTAAPNALRQAWLVTLAVLVLLILWRWPVAAGLPFSVDEAYYVVWSKTPDFGYWTKPPMIAWAVGLAGGVCGTTTGCIRTVPMVAFLLSGVLMFALARQLGAKPWAACLVACALSSSPLVAFYGLAATTDSLLLLSWIAAMLLMRRALDGERSAWIGAGIACGIGLLSKYSMGIFALSALLCVLHPQWRHWLRSPWPYVAAAVAALVFAPNLWWNLTHGSPTLNHTAEISASGGYAIRPTKLFEFWVAQFLLPGPIILVAFMVWIKRTRSSFSANDWYLLTFALPFLAVISLQALLARAHANWASPTYVAVTIAAVLYLVRRHPKWLVASFAINIAIGAVLYHFDGLVAQPLKIARSSKTDPFWAFRPWPEIVDQVRSAASKAGAHRYAVASENRGVLAQLQTNLPLQVGDAMGWQRQDVPQNHFDQRFRLPEKPHGRVLLVTQSNKEAVLAAFPSATFAGQAMSNHIADRPLAFSMWWVGTP